MMMNNNNNNKKKKIHNNNPLIKNSNNTEVPLEGEEETRHYTNSQPFVKITMNSDHKSTELIMITSLWLMTYQARKLRKTTQHTRTGVVMILTK